MRINPENQLRLLQHDVLEAERASDRLQTQIEQLIASNRDLSGLLLAADRRRGELMKLIVSFCRLIEATDASSAVRTLEEILVAVIGTEDFVVLACMEGDELSPICGMGPTFASAKAHPPRKALALSIPFENTMERTAARWQNTDVAACVQMRIAQHVVGVIVIGTLLVHRESLSVQDQEVLRHLGGFAGTAIMAAEERKQWTRLVIPANG